MSLSEAGTGAASPQPGVVDRAKDAWRRVQTEAPEALRRTRERIVTPTAGLKQGPSIRLPMPGGMHATFATDRVRARPAVSPTVSGFIGLNAIALGFLGTFFPRRVANFVGIDASRGAVVALFGLRELATGYALVSDPTRTPVLWARLLFDAFDIAVLKAAADDPFNRKRRNAEGVLKAVVAITVLDLIAAARLSTVKRNCD